MGSRTSGAGPERIYAQTQLSPWSEVRLYKYISQTHTQVHDARALFQRGQWWKSCRQLLGVSGVLDCTEWIR